jgi:hypothetical protein
MQAHFELMRRVEKYQKDHPDEKISFPLSPEIFKKIDEYFSSKKVSYEGARGWKYAGNGRWVDQNNKNIPRFPSVSEQNEWMYLASKYVKEHPETTYPLSLEIIRQLDEQLEFSKKKREEETQRLKRISQELRRQIGKQELEMCKSQFATASRVAKEANDEAERITAENTLEIERLVSQMKEAQKRANDAKLAATKAEKDLFDYQSFIATIQDI